MIQIGQSTNIHQLVRGRKLILGDVGIEHEMGLLGHSDTDALLHAIAGSILGVLALGDLGKCFPDTDEGYKGMNSLWMLRQVYKIMEERGYAIGNLDTMIMIERPKTAPHVPATKEHVAEALCCDTEQVSIKATYEEKLGFVGRGEGVQAQCVVLLYKREDITQSLSLPVIKLRTIFNFILKAIDEFTSRVYDKSGSQDWRLT